MACRRSIIYFSNYTRGEATEKAGCAVIWFGEENCRMEILYQSREVTSVIPTYCFIDGKCISGECLELHNGYVKKTIETNTHDFLSTGKRAEDLTAICLAGDYSYYGGGRLDGTRLSFLAKENPPYPAKQWVETVTKVVQEDTFCKPPTVKDLSETNLDVESNLFVQKQEQEEIEETIAAEQITEKQDREKKEGSLSLERLKDILPEMKLPTDGTGRKCYRMELSDIASLPKKWYPLQKNHFLLHGYYQYHHVLFICQTQAGEERYAVGVPGVFYYREQYMAETFGFLEFHPLKQGNRQRGEFGYWYLWLNK